VPSLLATLPDRPAPVRAVIAIVAVASLVLSVILAAGAVAGIRGLADGVDTATVERVLDGDTLDVTLHGETARVRLLNVDAPTAADPAREVDCLGAEAAAFLSELLPAGSEVTLEYDELRVDRYDRVLAAVSVGGTRVNAELARRGLGAPAVVSGDTRFLDEVRAASQEAADARVGLFSSSIGCTAPGRVEAAAAAIVALPDPGEDADATALATAAGTAAVTVAMASVLERSATAGTGIHWAVLGMERKATLLERLDTVIAGGHAVVAALRARVSSAPEA
jgi:micrococcal nuclease